MHRKKRGGSQMDAVLDELEECVSGKDDIERQWEMKELIAEINSSASAGFCRIFCAMDVQYVPYFIADSLIAVSFLSQYIWTI